MGSDEDVSVARCAWWLYSRWWCSLLVASLSQWRGLDSSIVSTHHPPSHSHLAPEHSSPATGYCAILMHNVCSQNTTSSLSSWGWDIFVTEIKLNFRTVWVCLRTVSIVTYRTCHVSWRDEARWQLLYKIDSKVQICPQQPRDSRPSAQFPESC